MKFKVLVGIIILTILLVGILIPLTLANESDSQFNGETILGGSAAGEAGFVTSSALSGNFESLADPVAHAEAVAYFKLNENTPTLIKKLYKLKW